MKQSIKKYKETYCFTHNGINIWVKIDYRNNRISLVQPFNDDYSKFSKKNWVFTDRGVEYMQGWLDILEAMKSAIIDAKKRYEAELAESSKFDEEQLAKAVKLVKKIK